MMPQLFWRVIMIKNIILAMLGYSSIGLLLLAGMLGKQVCTDILNDMFQVLIQ